MNVSSLKGNMVRYTGYCNGINNQKSQQKGNKWLRSRKLFHGTLLYTMWSPPVINLFILLPFFQFINNSCWSVLSFLAPTETERYPSGALLYTIQYHTIFGSTICYEVVSPSHRGLLIDKIATIVKWVMCPPVIFFGLQTIKPNKPHGYVQYVFKA